MWFRSRSLIVGAALAAAVAFGLSGPGAASAAAAAPTPPGPPNRPGATDDGIAPPDPTAATSPPLHGELSALPPLRPPEFWSGVCDSDRYPGNHPLGPASFRGVVACGPLDRERAPGEIEPDEDIGGGSTQYEWECVELVKRYMYLAGYISAAYPGNGKDIVANYPGGPHRMTAYHNAGTPGITPQPGDVVAFGAGTRARYGHTALVVGSYVDAAGNGTIDLLQENSGAHPTGTGSLLVEDWVVHAAAWGDAIDWLHDGRYPTYTGIGGSPVPASGAVVDRDGTARLLVGAGGTVRELVRTPGGWSEFTDAGDPPVAGQPVGVLDQAGVLRVFTVDPGGAVHEHDRDATGWRPWTDLGGAVTGRPAALVDPQGAIHVLATADGGAVVENDLVGGAWTGWTGAGVTAAPGTGPAELVDADGTVRTFVVDPGHQLRERLAHGRWSAVGGPVLATPIPVLDPTGTLRVFTRNAAGHVVAAERGRTATGWSAIDLGPGDADPVATVDRAGTVHVFTVSGVPGSGGSRVADGSGDPGGSDDPGGAGDPGGAVRERTLPARGAEWTPWAAVGAGAAASALLGAAVDRSGTAYVFTRDRDGTLGIDEALAGGGWTGVLPRPGVVLAAATVACVRCVGRHDPARRPETAGRTVCEGRRRRGTRTR